MNIKSVDDGRVGNSPTRHAYRTLSDDEKVAITEIKDAGEELIDAIMAVCDAGEHYGKTLTKHLLSLGNTDDGDIEPFTDEHTAYLRFLDAVMTDVDPDSQLVEFLTQKRQVVHAKESVMWAVRAITA